MVVSSPRITPVRPRVRIQALRLIPLQVVWQPRGATAPRHSTQFNAVDLRRSDSPTAEHEVIPCSRGGDKCLCSASRVTDCLDARR